MINDWINKAAKEIIEGASLSKGDITWAESVIEDYCPFKRDTVYEEVGETQKKLDAIQHKLDEVYETVRYLRSGR